MSCHGTLCFLKIGPSAKPMAGRAKAPAAMAPAVCAVPVMKRRRVTVSPSKAPGMFRSVVYFDLVLRRSSGTVNEGGGARILSVVPRRALCDGAHTPLPGGAGRVGVAGRVGGRGGGDRLGHDAHPGEVAGRGQLGQAERVEPVAREQREVGI